MMDVIKHWIQNLYSYYANDLNVITHLQEIPMDRKITDELIGMLIRKAVLQNAKNEMNSPMNVTQVHRMIEAGSEVLTKEDFSNFTAWDFQNCLTSVIKPSTCDMLSVLQTQHAVAKFVCEAFKIPLN